MKNRKSKIALSLLILSIGLNLIFYFIGMHPVIIKKVFKDNYMDQISVEEYKDKVLDAGLIMAASEKTLMPFGDHSNFLVELRKVINRRERDAYFNYSFPKAFLMSGLLEFAITNNDTLLVKKITDIFKKYINDDGSLSFDLDKVDQAPFGLSFIYLHQFYKEPKYKKGADEIYDFLKNNQKPENKLILYRENTHKQFVDVLGMITPFLIKYGVTYHDSNALNIAYNQVLFYIKNGLEERSHLPFHAISLDTNLLLGPATWGRGIGWYAISLAYIIHYTNISNNPNYSIFRDEMDRLYEELMPLRVHKYWGQFITGNPNDEIDTSTTTMLLYAFSLAGKNIYSERELVGLLANYTNIEGYLDFTSGDTYTVNRYALEKGKSELSQGILLSVLGLYD